MSGHPPHRGLVELDESEALALAATMPIARLAYVIGGRIFITPVNFVLDDRTAYLRTAEGAGLLGAARNGLTAALEVDDVVDWSRSGWSALIRGQLSEVTDPEEMQQVLSGELRPWAEGDRNHVVRLVGDEVTGRRIEPGSGVRTEVYL